MMRTATLTTFRSRTLLTSTAALATAAALSMMGSVRAAARPSFVVILADDLGFADLGCYGSEIETPHLDALAAGGVRWTRFYNTGRCWPTRASLLTGLYPHQARHAMVFGGDAPPAYRGTSRDVAPMVSERLRKAGYRTYHVGKWHLNGPGRHPDPTWPLGRGFDRSYFLRTQNNFFDPREIYDEHRAIHRPGGDYYATEVLSDRAVEYLDEHATYHRDEPFFLYLAYTAPHFPLHALPEDIARYRGKYIEGWDTVRAERWRRQQDMGIVRCGLSPRDPDAPAWETLTEEEQRAWDERMALHAAMIHCIDRGVGRVVRKLESLGALDDTLILFLSDNGASAEYIVRGDGHDPAAPAGSAATYLCLEVGWANAANTPFRFHKIWTHEGGIATPFIAHWPRGIAARSALHHGVAHVIDVAPTLLELAGVEWTGPVAGRSLAPAFAGREHEPHRHLFWEHVGNRALREGDWKLVAEHGGRWELYDLAHDRSETNDLAARHPDRVARMARLWEEQAQAIGVVEWDRLPQSRRLPSPEYRRK